MPLLRWLRSPHYVYAQNVVYSRRTDPPSVSVYLERNDWIRWQWLANRWFDWVVMRTHRVPIISAFTCDTWCMHADFAWWRPFAHQRLTDLTPEQITPGLRERWGPMIGPRPSTRRGMPAEVAEAAAEQMADQAQRGFDLSTWATRPDTAGETGQRQDRPLPQYRLNGVG